MLNALEFEKIFPEREEKQQARYPCVFAPLPGWRVHAKVFLIDCVKRSKVSHGPYIQVDQDNVLHLPASAVQLTWTQTAHYNVNHSSVAAFCKS